jgi:NAD(P)H-flavin reductase
MIRPPTRFTCALVNSQPVGDKYVQLTLEMITPPELQFEAGQYVSLKVAERGDRRSYSIANIPSVGHAFELLVDVTPQGLGSTYLQNLKVGERVEGLGPLGMFTLADDEPARVMVATGSGVAPFRSMALHLLQTQGSTAPLTLYWGVRHVEDLCYVEEFEQLSMAFPHFQFHPVISQPISGWTLCRGRVTDCLATHAFDDSAGYYLCGNAGMITAVVSFLQEKGLRREQVHFEKFY